MLSTRPKCFVFVLMPFDRDFDDVYQFGIKAACEEVGAYSERVDEQIFQENILERLYMQINKADLIVADMSGKNPNVFYEVGYAHALGKKVILLTDKAEDIPFDLKHFPHVVYQGRIGDLKKELSKRVSWHIENPDKRSAVTAELFQIFVNGTELADQLIRLSDVGVHSEDAVWEDGVGESLRRKTVTHDVILQLKNRSKLVLTEEHFKIFFLLPNDISIIGNDVGIEYSYLPGNVKRVAFAFSGRLFPEEWIVSTLY